MNKFKWDKKKIDFFFGGQITFIPNVVKGKNLL